MTVQDLAKEWIIKSDNNLISAKSLFQNTYPKQLEIIAYLIQQTLELIIKAVYSNKNIRIPKTHDLIVLSETIFDDPKLIPNYNHFKEISSFAVDIRYPNDIDVSEDIIELYLQKVEETSQWIKSNYLF